MNKIILSLCVVLLASTSSDAAEIYKWKDSDGKVRYSDQPPVGKTPFEILSGKNAAAVRSQLNSETKKTSKPGTDTELDARKRQAEVDKEQKKSQGKVDDQTIREKNCATAKSNQQNYKQGGRIYKIDEKGERQYLEQSDITSELEKANQEVEQWCASQ